MMNMQRIVEMMFSLPSPTSIWPEDRNGSRWERAGSADSRLAWRRAAGSDRAATST